MVMDHNSAPIFQAFWVLIGLLMTFPWYSDLLVSELEKLSFSYSLWLLLLLKGGFLWLLIYNGQVLTRHSMSAANFVLPTALGVIAIINSYLGEELAPLEWIAALGLCALGIIFSLHGHVQELGSGGKILFFKLICFAIACATSDFLILKETNWYVLLLTTNIFLLFICLARRISFDIWRQSIFRKEAALAGSVFGVDELIKFYLMVSIIPMTVIISVQAAIIPIILTLSSLLWGERGWKEQFLWGVLSASLLLLLFL